MVFFFATLFAFALLCFTQAVDYCPPLGPVYELPRNLSVDASIRLAAQNLTSTLDKLLENGNASTLGFAPNTTSFSIGLFSAHETDYLFQYHFTASILNASSTTKVDENTVYRIGSISKLVTVLALLLQEHKVHFDDPVTKYIPELARYSEQNDEDDDDYDDIATTKWSQITVGALASHLAGIGRVYSFSDFSFDADTLVTNIGFPVLNSSDVPRCGRDSSQPPCSKQDFLQGLNKRHPVYAPFTTPVYSNAAFEILGYVLEKVTSQPYETVVQNTIFKPLGLSRSTVSKPRNTSQGVVPVGKSDWDFDLGGGSADGGIYMSTKDLSNLGRAILKSTLLTPVQTRKWLKPQTNTASLRAAVGAPWEIYRVPGLTQDGRVIDLYTKNGGIGLYSSLLVLVPDYDIGLTIFAAGNGNPVFGLSDSVLGRILPLIEKVGKKQAAARYSGVYDFQSSGSSKPSSSVEISVDKGPGLVVTRWISKTKDILQAYQDLLGSKSTYIDMRLYPTGLKTKGNRKSVVSYRAVFQTLQRNATSEEKTTAETSSSIIFSGTCPDWSAIDAFVYGGIGVDDFVFHTNSLGEVESVEPRAARTTLKKRASGTKV